MAEEKFQWNPVTIKTAFENGEIDSEQAANLTVQHQLKNNFYDMKPVAIKRAYDQGWIDKDAVKRYRLRKEKPFWWHVDDVRRGLWDGTIAIAKGAEKAVENTVTGLNELVVPPYNALMPGTGLDLPVKWRLPDYIPEPQTTGGRISESLTQFGVGLIPATKIAKAGQLNTVLSQQFAKVAPKAAKVLTSIAESAVVGAGVDYFVFDPQDGKLADLMKDLDVLPEFLDFMTTDPNNPAPYERLKNVLEGAGLGIGFDAVLSGIRALKSATYAKYFGDLDELAAEINSVPHLAESHNSIKLREMAEVEARKKPIRTANIAGLELEAQRLKKKPELTVQEQKRLEYFEEKIAKLKADGADSLKSRAGSDIPSKEIVEPRSSEGAVAKEYKVESRLVSEDEVRNARIFKRVKDSIEPEFEDTFIPKMEELEDAQTIIKTIWDEAGQEIDKAKKTVTHKQTDAKASKEIKKLASAVGGSPEAIVNNMRNIYGEVQGITSKARAMYRVFAHYSDEVGKMARNHDGSFESMMKITEHIKLIQEMQHMVYGVRAESGRLLNMHNMKLGKSRFDFANIKSIDSVPDFVRENKEQLERMIKDYGSLKNMKDRLKFSKFMGQGGVLQWLLNYKQAALLWNVVTHAVNISSQSGALMFKMGCRTLADLITAGTHRNSEYLNLIVKEWAGLGQALKTSFSFDSKKAKIRHKELMSQQDMTFREAILRNPEIGTFYRATIGREGIIDPTVKIGQEAALEKILRTHKCLGTLRTLDTILKIPFHALAGVDEVFKTLGTQMEYNSLIYRKGIKRGLRGSELDAFYKAELKKPNVAVFNEALKVGKEVTFQDNLGKAGRGIQSALNNSKLGTMARIAFIPFFKTTVNILKYAVKNSALGFLSKTVQKNLAKGGVDMWETLTRITAGTAFMLYGWHLYEEGKITGRMPRQQRDILSAAGVKEYSMYDEKNRKWVSYRRTDPAGMLWAAAADFYMAMDVYDQYQAGDLDVEFEEVFAAFALAFTDPVVNATWMKGAKDAMDFVGDPDMSRHKLKQLGFRQVESLIPATTLIDWAKTEFGSDQFLREINHLTDILHKKMNSTELLYKRHPIYGTPMKRDKRWHHAVSQRSMTTDPVLVEMVKTGANIRSPKEYLQLANVRVELTPEEVDRFEQIVARFPVQETLRQIVSNEGFQQIGDEDTKADILKGVVSKFREAAKGVFLGENSEVTQDIINRAVRKAEAIAGWRMAEDPTTQLYHWEKLMQQEE